MTDPKQIAIEAAERCDGHVREMRHHYPTAIGEMRRFADARGSAELGDWPVWCWVPMAGAYAIVSGGGPHRVPLGQAGDVARVAALTAWRLGRGVYLLDADVAADAVQAARSSERVPRDRILDGLPEYCCYVVTDTRPEPERADGPPIPKGYYVHLEHDMNTGRPELRVLLDTDGSWDGLTPVIIYLDRRTLRASATDVVAQARAAMAGTTGTDLRGIPLGHETDPAAGLEWAMGYMVWPVVLALTSPEVRIVGAERPGERPQRARPTANQQGKLAWREAPQPRVWRVTYTTPAPDLRPV